MLLIDLGNTRLKWRWLPASGKPCSGALVASELAQAPFWSRLEAQEAVWVSAVGDHGRRQALDGELQRRGLPAARYVVSPAVQAGLRNAYAEPARLGVDRWLAMLAAWTCLPVTSVVIDCGSAITVDAFTADGTHRGGHIVPGWRLLREALLRGTADVGFSAAVTSGEQPGHRTADAVANGCLAMMRGYLQRVLASDWCADAQAIWLTGGDADWVAELVPSAHRAPELVLDGLAAHVRLSGGDATVSGTATDGLPVCEPAICDTAPAAGSGADSPARTVANKES